MKVISSLIRKAQRGDKDAFIALIDQHRQMLYNTALLTLKNEDDALDAMQDTILSCWENLSRLKQEKYFETWLTRILLNKCYDILRQRGRLVSEEALPEPGVEFDWDTILGVKKTMKALPCDDQVLLSLYYYDGMSVREIAKALSLTEGAVRTRLSRSRNRFKQMYSNKEKCL